ncbi:MAG: hypothetical protein Mars2KO_16290 [Maribacter sp.]
MKLLLPLLLLLALRSTAQERPIQVVTEDIPNRLAFYAINENDEDVDVMLTVSGTNFRQSKGRPRLVRVPGVSKVHLKTIILIRGKQPNYTYDLQVNDSLSRRALRKEAKPIKVKPKKSITLYITDECQGCDSILVAMERGKYKFNAHRLNERPELKDQLRSSFPTTLDSISTPIFNLGGRLYTRIEDYDQLLEKLKQD